MSNLNNTHKKSFCFSLKPGCLFYCTAAFVSSDAPTAELEEGKYKVTSIQLYITIISEINLG